MIDLKSKKIMISGGAGLIGSHFAELILKNNGIPICLDISKEKLNNLKKKLNKYDKEFSTIQIDLTNEKKIIRCTKYILKKYKNIIA